MLPSPWTLSSLPLELPVLCITRTVDLIKPLIRALDLKLNLKRDSGTGVFL